MLRKLFSHLQAGDQAAVGTDELTWAFGWTEDQAQVQHDIHELNRILLDALHRSLQSSTLGRGLVPGLFGGSFVSRVLCEECGTVSERVEDFLDVTVPVHGFDNISVSVSTMQRGLTITYRPAYATWSLRRACEEVTNTCAQLAHARQTP